MRKSVVPKLTLIVLAAVVVLSLTAASVILAASRPQMESATENLPRLVVVATHGGPTVKVPPPSEFFLNRSRTANIAVTYQGSWSTQARTAFDYAVGIWESLVTSPVQINVVAEWVSMDTNILGGAWAEEILRNFPNAPLSDTWYASALANKLHGSDLSTLHDINAQFNKSFPDWYFGTDGKTPTNKYDFVSVVLHELCHGLGYFDSFDVSGASGSWGYTENSDISPVIYDRYVVNGSGQLLISSFPNPSTQLKQQLTSNNIFFNGPYAMTANNNSKAALYAPSPYQPGSSIAHLGEVFNGTPNALMTYALSDGESIHDPGPVSLGILRDIGWTLEGQATSAPTITGLPDQVVPMNGSLNNAIDLWAYASDNESPDNALTFTINNTPNASAGVSIDSNRYIDIFPATSWTGQTDVEIKVADPGGLFSTDTFRVTVSNIKTWTGSVSTSWHTAGNWNPSGVPTASDNVTIPNVANDPVISTGDAAVNSLTVASGAVVDLTTRRLTVEGTLTNNGTLKQSQTVNQGVTTNFLRITNQAGTQTKYYGLDLMPTVDNSSSITNGDFESGPNSQGQPIGWSASNNGLSFTLIDSQPTYPNIDPNIPIGNYSLLLGAPDYNCQGIPLGSATVEQSFSVPNVAPGTPLYLVFDYILYTQDGSASATYDRFEVYINNGNGNQLIFSEGNPSSDGLSCSKWLRIPETGWGSAQVDLTSYRGQTVTLSFQNWNRFDGNYNTFTYLDNIQIVEGTTVSEALAEIELPQPGPKRSDALRPEVLPSPFFNPRTGFRPPEMALTHLTGQMPRMAAPQALPDAYDWRNVGGTNYVTSVKDQANCGSCYSFASLGNIESRLLIDSAGTYDFSENNAKECNWRELNNYSSGGSPWGSCDGGNYFMLASLFSQKGTVLESCDPYQDSDVACNSSCAYQKTLLDWRIISGDAVPDPEVLKQYIYDHGPIYTSMYADEAQGFNSMYTGSYTLNYTPSSGDTNHAVLIVGWSNALPPVLGSLSPATGWIVKNSWGATWGAGGYFYITYGAGNIGKFSSYIQEWQDYDSSGGLLYYDEDGWSNNWGWGDTTAWGLVKFVPTSNTNVNRIEFWTTDVTTDVDVYLYDSFDGTNLSGLLASKENLSYNEAGYHSVLLDSPVAVTGGNDIFAVVHFGNSSYGYPVPADTNGPYETGKTYLSHTGGSGSWTDLGSEESNDVAIRVRTSAGSSNTAPTLTGLPDQTVAMNGRSNNAIDLWAYASDNETTDSGLTFTIDNSPNPSAGVTIDSNRYIDITPASGWTGQTDVTIKVADPGGLFATDTFRVSVVASSTSVTVSVSGNQFCSGRSLGVKRCFDITSVSTINATVRFYFTEAERNGQVVNDLKVLHYKGSWIEEAGPYTRGGSGDAQYVQAQNLNDFSPFALAKPGGASILYIPVIRRSLAALPAAPVLNSLTTPNTTGSYNVGWNAADLATSYTLEEDTENTFPHPTQVYNGANTSWDASGKTNGWYCYRVRSNNSYGSSDWSAMQCLQVALPAGPTPGYWSGTGVELYVTADRQYVHDFAVSISVQGCGSYKITHTSPDAQITNNQFSFSGSFYASGTFTSNTAANGTGGFNNFYIYGCGYIKGTFTWSATWKHSAQALFVPQEVIKLEGFEAVLPSFRVIPEPNTR